MTEKSPIPADDALAALTDDALLAMLEDHGIDASGIGDREGAIAALKLKRDTAPELGGEQAPPPAPPPPGEGATDQQPPEQEALELDTRADVDEPQRSDGPTRFSAMVAQAVRNASGDAPRHAALHNFEVALADFRKAAQNLADQGMVEQGSDVAYLVDDVLRFF